MQLRFDALILAGSNPADPGSLARAEGLSNKALIEVGGRPMIARVVEAVVASPRIGQVAVVGLNTGAFDAPPDVHLIPNAGGLVDNLMAGLHFWAERRPSAERLFILDADTPLLTGEMVTWFLDACLPADGDLYYGVVERATVLARFPRAQRTWLRTRDGRYCGADLFVGYIPALLKHEARLRALVARRKSVPAELRLLGWGWVARLLLGRIRLWELRAAVERLLGIRGSVIVLPFAEAAIDVDKAADLALVRHAIVRNAVAHPSPSPLS